MIKDREGATKMVIYRSLLQMIEADVLTSLKYNYNNNCGFGSVFGQLCFCKNKLVLNAGYKGKI